MVEVVMRRALLIGGARPTSRALARRPDRPAVEREPHRVLRPADLLERRLVAGEQADDRLGVGRHVLDHARARNQLQMRLQALRALDPGDSPAVRDGDSARLEL